MNLCSDDHDEVCFERRACPVCAKEEEIAKLDRLLDTANYQIKDLERQLDEATSE